MSISTRSAADSNDQQFTPLVTAAMFGVLPVVKHLFDKDRDIHALTPPCNWTGPCYFMQLTTTK